MNKTQIELKDKIIDLKDFFQRAADELWNKAGLTRFHFMVPDDKNGGFMTKHSTLGANIYFTEKELCTVVKGDEEKIIYPKSVFRNYGLLRRWLFTKIYWKIHLHAISAIMPIYRDSKVICLILFSDRLADNWLNNHTRYINALQREITHCLEAILLYNQALEGIIKNRSRSIG